MTEIGTTNQIAIEIEPENASTPLVQEPKDGRLLTAPINGKLGGRPRGSGVEIVDWTKYIKLGLSNRTNKQNAGYFGMSVGTFKRRKAEWVRQQDLDW